MFHVPARPLSGLHPFDAHLPGMVACSGYHRFTLPRRDTVMVATCVPRRNTTLVLDNPHARPIGAKTTTGFDPPRATAHGRNRGRSRWLTGIETLRRKARKRENCGLTERAQKRYVVSQPHVARRHSPCPGMDAPASQPHTRRR